MNSAPAYFLSSERLGFRPWSEEDFPLAMALWGDAQVTRLIGGPFSESQVRERLAKEIGLMETRGIQYWPMFLLAGGDFVGCCGLRPYASNNKVLELGFHLRPVHWGQGLAGESARAAIRLARESLNADGLFAGHHPDNVASQKVLSKLGFRFTHEELYPPTGRMHRCYFLGFSKQPCVR